MKPEPRAARRAATFVILAAALWWHAWMPMLVLVGFVAWALLHTRFQGVRRDGFMRLRRRLWPPSPVVLVAVIVAGTALYVLSTDSLEAKLMPIVLNVVAAATVLVGDRRRVTAS